MSKYDHERPTWAITMAQSQRGNYHISRLKYPELAVDDEVQSFKPMCGTRATQRYTTLGEEQGQSAFATWSRYIEVATHLDCFGCHYDKSLPILNEEIRQDKRLLEEA